jgi:ADP-ribose pyrophosphatase YjhB (NUDIX family)
MFTIGVFSVIFDVKKRVLLCHRRDLNVWNLPGGGMEPGELPTETAIRETLEETGLHVKIERLVGVYSKPDKNDMVFVFTAIPESGELTLNHEADQLAYFKVNKFPKNTIPKHVDRVTDALLNLPEPVFRFQAGPSARKFLKMLTGS